MLTTYVRDFDKVMARERSVKIYRNNESSLNKNWLLVDKIKFKNKVHRRYVKLLYPISVFILLCNCERVERFIEISKLFFFRNKTVSYSTILILTLTLIKHLRLMY